MRASDQRKSVLASMMWSFAEKISAQLVSFVVSIVLARVLMPEEFGLISMMLVFIVLAEVFVNSGFSSALIQNKDADDTDFSTIFYMSFACSLGVYALLFSLAQPISQFYEQSALVVLIQVFALKIPIASFNAIQRAYVARNMLFRRLFYSALIGTIASGAIGIAMAMSGWGVWSLVAQNILLTIFDSIVLLITVPWRPKRLFSFERGLRMMKYGWKVLLADFSGNFFGQLRNLAIGKVYTSADLAFYDRGNQIPQIVGNNIGNAVSSVLFPVMSNCGDDLDTVKNLCRRSMKTMSYVISPLMFGIAACGPALVLLLYSDKWSGSIPFVQLLAVGYAFGVIGMVPIQALKAIGESGAVLKLELVKKPFFLLLLFFGVSHSVWAVALSMLAYELFGFVVNATQLKRYLGYSFKEQLLDVLPHIALAAATALAVAFIDIDGMLALTLTAQVVAGVIVYIGGSVVLKLDSLQYIMQIARRKD